MKKSSDLAKGWFRKGDSDLVSARATLKTSGPYDTVCFHAQQSVEKYLKGFLTLCQCSFPYTHDLIALNLLCKEIVSDWPILDETLSVLTSYGVNARYDLEFFPDLKTAQEALHLAVEVKNAVLKAITNQNLNS